LIKNNIIMFAVVALLFGCTTNQYRTDAEMFATANEIYRDYLFEYGIDSDLFSSPITKELSNGNKSYKWVAMGASNLPIGVEVIVAKSKKTKPEMILIGNTDAWLPLVGSKNKRKPGRF
jgi:hypothetical protein